MWRDMQRRRDEGTFRLLGSPLLKSGYNTHTPKTRNQMKIASWSFRCSGTIHGTCVIHVLNPSFHIIFQHVLNFSRGGWAPRSLADFGDGGAFPEIHMAQQQAQPIPGNLAAYRFGLTSRFRNCGVALLQGILWTWAKQEKPISRLTDSSPFWILDFVHKASAHI